jgi:hypothetical protein
LQGVWAHSKELQQEVLQLLQKKKVTLLRTIAYDLKIDMPMPCILLSSPTL